MNKKEEKSKLVKNGLLILAVSLISGLLFGPSGAIAGAVIGLLAARNNKREEDMDYSLAFYDDD